MNEFEFCCTNCDQELTYYGDQWHAEADCSECGQVVVSPRELWESDEAERLGDMERDGV